MENAEIRIRNNVKENLNDAEIFIFGDRQNVNAKEAKTRINEALEDILNNDYGENKRMSLEYLDHTITGACDILKIISHSQAVELREPVVRELGKYNK